MIVLIDNYDSFSYNLYQLIGSVEPDIRVFRNDAVTTEELRELAPEAIILSPGPGKPADAGICEDIVRELGSEIPILGVCLGHQAIVEALGGTVGYAKELMHGKSSAIAISENSRLLGNVPQGAQVARYHSLAAIGGDDASWPQELLITATDESGEIMAVEHSEHPVFGLQFHPESIMTPDGQAIIETFIGIARS